MSKYQKVKINCYFASISANLSVILTKFNEILAYKLFEIIHKTNNIVFERQKYNLTSTCCLHGFLRFMDVKLLKLTRARITEIDKRIEKLNY